MRPTLSLIRREFSAFFLSPIAYVVLCTFLLMTGNLFRLTLEQLTETGPRGIGYSMEIMVGNTAFWLVYLFIPPLLTMRLFAEERSSGTLEMLLTAPIRDWQVVFAKYVACFGFYTVMWLPTLLYLPILGDWTRHESKIDFDDVLVTGIYFFLALFIGLAIPSLLLLAIVRLFQLRILASLISLVMIGILGAIAAIAFTLPITTQHWITYNSGIDAWPIATTYIGLALAGAMFLSIGLFVSSLVTNQMIAAMISLFIGVIFIAGHFLPELNTSVWFFGPYQVSTWVLGPFEVNPADIIFYFTVPLHFERNWSRGLIDTRQLVLYTSVTLFCLFLTVRSVESRRWR
jgi:ABC-2 type transport system permease protein